MTFSKRKRSTGAAAAVAIGNQMGTFVDLSSVRCIATTISTGNRKRIPLYSSFVFGLHRSSSSSIFLFSFSRFKTTRSGSEQNHMEGLVRDHCKSGAVNLDEALDLFNQLLHMRFRPSITPFTQLLGALVKIKQYPTVLSLFRSMASSSIPQDIVTLTILINCYCRLGRVDFGFAILGNIFKCGFQPSHATLTTLLKGLYMDGKIDHAMILFNKIVDYGYPCNKFTYTIIIGKLCKDNWVNEATELFQEMTCKGVRPDVVTYNSLSHELCSLGLWEKAASLFDDMLSNGITPDVVTFSCMIVSRMWRSKHRKIRAKRKGFKKKSRLQRASQVP